MGDHHFSRGADELAPIARTARLGLSDKLIMPCASEVMFCRCFVTFHCLNDLIEICNDNFLS